MPTTLFSSRLHRAIARSVTVVAVVALSLTGFTMTAVRAGATPPVAPGAPTSVQVQEGGSWGDVVVTWTPPTSSGDSAITSYTATFSPSGRTCSYTVSVPEDDSCIIEPGFNPDTDTADTSILGPQTVTVTATNANGHTSSPSSNGSWWGVDGQSQWTTSNATAVFGTCYSTLTPSNGLVSRAQIGSHVYLLCGVNGDSNLSSFPAQSTSTLLDVSASTGGILHTWTLNFKAQNMASDGTNLWIVDGTNLYKVTASTGAIAATTALPVSMQMSGVLTFNPSNPVSQLDTRVAANASNVWVTSGAAATTVAHFNSSGSLVGTVTLPSNDKVGDVSNGPGGNGFNFANLIDSTEVYIPVVYSTLVGGVPQSNASLLAYNASTGTLDHTFSLSVQLGSVNVPQGATECVDANGALWCLDATAYDSGSSTTTWTLEAHSTTNFSVTTSVSTATSTTPSAFTYNNGVFSVPYANSKGTNTNATSGFRFYDTSTSSYLSLKLIDQPSSLNTTTFNGGQWWRYEYGPAGQLRTYSNSTTLLTGMFYVGSNQVIGVGSATVGGGYQIAHGGPLTTPGAPYDINSLTGTGTATAPNTTTTLSCDSTGGGTTTLNFNAPIQGGYITKFEVTDGSSNNLVFDASTGTGSGSPSPLGAMAASFADLLALTSLSPPTPTYDATKYLTSLQLTLPCSMFPNNATTSIQARISTLVGTSGWTTFSVTNSYGASSGGGGGAPGSVPGAPGSTSTSTDVGPPGGQGFDSSGNFYYLDQSNNIQEIAAGTTTSTPVVSGYSVGIGSLMAIDDFGNIYAVNFGTGTNGVIDKFSGGSPTPTVLTPTNMPLGTQQLAVFGSTLFAGGCATSGGPPVPNGCGITKIVGSTGTPIASGVNFMGQIAVDSAGDVFYSSISDGTISEIAAGTTTSTLIYTAPGSSPNNMIFGLAVDGAGNIYFSNPMAGTVSELPSGLTTATVVQSVPGADFLGIASGQVEVQSYNQTTSHNELTTFGTPVAPVATASDGQATVTYLAPGSAGSSPITSYTVTATDTTNSANGGQTCTTTDGTTLTCTVTGLTNGDSYTFKVKATNAVGTGPASTVSNSVTPSSGGGGGGGGGSASPPDAPTSPSATAGNATASVSWTTPTTHGSSITGYLVTPRDTTTSTNLTAQSCSSSPCTITGLTNGDNYTFTIIATSEAGNSSASTATTAVTPTSGGGGGGGSFSCAHPFYFELTNGKLYTSTDRTTWTFLARIDKTVSAIGFNPDDDYLYGIRSKRGNVQLVKISSTGTLTTLGHITGLPSTHYGSADINQATGTYYVSIGYFLASIDLSTRVATLLPVPSGFGKFGKDIVAQGNAIWTMSKKQIKGFDLTTGVITRIAIPKPDQAATASLFDSSDGNSFEYVSTWFGSIFKVDHLTDGSTPSFSKDGQFPVPPSATHADGASACLDTPA